MLPGTLNNPSNSQEKFGEPSSNIPLLRKLISAVKDKNKCDIEDIFNKNNAETLKELLIHKDEHGWTALHYAAQWDNAPIIEWAIKNKVGQSGTLKKEYPIHIAARQGFLHIIKILTTPHGNQLKPPTEEGYSAFHLAAINGHYDCVVHLCKHGANLLEKINNRNTILELPINDQLKNLLQPLKFINEQIDLAIHLPFDGKEKESRQSNWPQGGKERENFKTIFEKGFNSQDKNINEITRHLCIGAKLIKKSNNSPDQLLYILCAGGYADLVDFLVEKNIHFNYENSSYQYTKRRTGNKPDIAKQYLGLYCAIDFFSVQVVEVFLKTQERFDCYFEPIHMPEVDDNVITPMQYAESLLKGSDGDEKELLQEIVGILREKQKQYVNKEKNTQVQSGQNRKRKLTSYYNSMADILTRLESHAKPSDKLFVDKKKLKHNQELNNNNSNHNAKGDDKDDYMPEDENQEMDEKNANKGIIGEAKFFFYMREKYKEQLKVGDDKIIHLENGCVITSDDPNHPSHQPRHIKIIWNNKERFQRWRNEIKAHQFGKFKDPGNHHYDLKITENYDDEKQNKTSYFEVKATETNQPSLTKLTGAEFDFMNLHKKNYKLCRIHDVLGENPRYTTHEGDTFLEEDFSNVTQLNIKI